MNQSLIQFIWIVLALGLPASTTALAFKVTSDARSALGVCVLTVVVEVIFGFVNKVWLKLEPKWVERTADWLDAKVLSLFSGYRGHYLEYITYQHRAFDVKGLTTQGVYTLELEHVFVQLGIAAAPVDQVPADPLKLIPEELRTGSRSIWEYLKSPHLSTQNFAIIGPPGSGKTTLLKHMALTLASPSHRRQVGAPDRLPILLFLRDQASAIKANPDISLPQMIRDQFAKWGAPLAPADWLEAQLEQGRCLVMLDGLDEVADLETRQRVATWVENRMTAYGKNRFIISSRPHGYRTNPLAGVTVLQVHPFSFAQVRQFVENWYLANEIMASQRDDPGVRATAHQGSEDLLKRIQSTSALSALAVNPLLLTMIATVHRYRSSLPGRRVELYAEICEVFLGKRKEAIGLVSDLTPKQKQRILQPLAYYMMCHDHREIKKADVLDVIAIPLLSVKPDASGEDFLKMIENTSGLLIERESDVYGFAHKTYQEYLASVHILEERTLDTLLSHVAHDWWHETIRLYCAQADASPVIMACLDNPSVMPLRLAIECMDEAREVKLEVRQRYQQVIEHGAEDPDPERRRAIAEALLASRLGSADATH